MELTAQDQALVNTDFGEEIEKMAAERVGACQEAYAYGFAKLAAEAADAKDEEDKKEKEGSKEDKEEKMDEESEKAASELGNFIERGVFDGLRKLGSERHGDEMHYLWPIVEEKIAANAASAAASKAWNAVKGYHQSIATDVKGGLKNLSLAAKKELDNPATGGKVPNAFRKGEAVAGAKQLGSAALKASPYAVLGGGALMAAKGGKKEEQPK